MEKGRKEYMGDLGALEELREARMDWEGVLKLEYFFF